MKSQETTQLRAKLRAKGLRATPQRLAVLRAVQGMGSHPCADEVYHSVRTMIPSISLATVYKALAELRGAGEVRVLPVAGKLRFDGNTTLPHHHLVCERCTGVADVEMMGFSAPELTEEQRRGFEISGVELTFTGTCPRCGGQSDKPQASPGLGMRAS